MDESITINRGKAGAGRLKSWAGEFREFILRGNVVDLAFAVVIGLAFQNVVTALIDDFITPLIAAIFGNQNFAESYFTINGSQFKYGHFINAVLNLILVGLVLYLIVRSYNRFYARNREEEKKASRNCPVCAADIPLDGKKCMYCQSDLTPDSELPHPTPA